VLLTAAPSLLREELVVEGSDVGLLSFSIDVCWDETDRAVDVVEDRSEVEEMTLEVVEELSEP